MSAKKSNEIPRGLTITVEELHKRWTEFQLLYPTNESCIEGILILGKFDARQCINCDSVEKIREKGSPHSKCAKCGQLTNLFKGTFFAKMRKPRAYLAALWLRSEQIGISSNRFSQLVGIAQSTAYEIQKRIDITILEMAMEEAVTMYSGEFRAVISKRSSETPAREKPIVEQELVDEETIARRHEKSERSERSEQSEKSEQSENEQVREESKLPTFQDELQASIYKSLSDSKTIHFDELCGRLNVRTGDLAAALLMMQLENQIVEVGADYYKKHPEQQDVLGLSKFFKIDEAKLQQFFNHVKHVFHGISRKNLQMYLAWFWSLVGVAFRNLDDLVGIFSNSRHVSRHEIRYFVTPATVKVLPA